MLLNIELRLIARDPRRRAAAAAALFGTAPMPVETRAWRYAQLDREAGKLRGQLATQPGKRAVTLPTWPIFRNSWSKYCQCLMHVVQLHYDVAISGKQRMRLTRQPL
jgi:hypothetical protein